MSKYYPRFGYKNEEGIEVPDKDEQKVLRYLKELRGPDEKPKMSYSDVAGVLNSENLFNRGKYWSGETVRYLLKREKEAGWRS